MAEFVRLDPDVVDEIVAICNTMLKELIATRETANRLLETRGFGDLESARQLADGYARKAAGTPESARERIDQFIATLTDLRDAFASGGEAFLEAEFDWARQLREMETEL
ncbi:hypothetical protein HF877_18670 [Rhodococcus sp. BL-253-APC-6A1W]|uniref:hypothetical protein n=1 Tax=Rhodococcus sp. BL-253-APC-6A1W TaxID=2725307 RepID=UPI00146D3128|nr:hypothetical protein [Rhodococcus sp. BL-253-APC-6A1W]NMD97398.1 hypothetical protein [Rhodococcus sp. BL-253-APC-6A1W]